MGTSLISQIAMNVFFKITTFFVFIPEVNAKDLISGGALWELVRISRDCSRDDIKALACRTLTSSPTFVAELRRLRIEV